MSKAIGNIFALGLAPEPNDEENERLEQLSRQALPYLQSAKPLEGEDFRNSADKYLRILENAKGDNNQSNYNFAKPTTAFTENNLQYAQLANTNIATDAINQSNNVDYSLYGDDFSKEEIDQMLGDERFQNIMDTMTRENEGGYVNNPNDFGGETKYGISKRWYPQENIRDLTQERASALLYRDYWKKTNINQLPDELADIVFDDSVVQGQPTAIRNLQKALGVKTDGIIGPDTIKAFDGADYNYIKNNFINNVEDKEDEYLKQNPSQRIFERGHKKRFRKYR